MENHADVHGLKGQDQSVNGIDDSETGKRESILEISSGFWQFAANFRIFFVCLFVDELFLFLLSGLHGNLICICVYIF